MATQQTKGALGFLPEVSPEAAEANRRYMEAQRKLAETLDVRKNRTFDPMWLAAAQGFLGPTRTGSAFEALGRVAGNVGEAQAKEQELAKQIAGQELELAGAGIGLERMRQRDRAFQQMLGQGAPAAQQTRLSTGRGGLPPVGGEQPAQAAPQGALPASAQPAQQGALPAPPPALAGLPGQQVAPPNPDFMSGADFINISRFDPNADPAKIMKEAQELEQKRVEIREGGAFDRATGMFYQFPKGEVMEREIPGTGKTFRLTPQQAILHDIYLSNNDPRYWDLAKQIMEGPTRPGEPAAARPAGAGAPGAAPGAAPAAGRPAFRSKSEAEAEAAEAKAIAEGRAKTAVEKEAELEKDLSTADKIDFLTTQSLDQVKAAQKGIGIFAKPGVGSAIATLLTEGVRVGSSSVSIPAVEDAVRKAKAEVTKEDIATIQSLSGNLAELELLYTQMYLKGGGSVTEAERAIVRRIPGTPSSDATVLDEKLRLLRMRADFDRRRIEAFYNYMETEGPRGNYLKFTRSPEFKEMRKQFQQDLYSAFNLQPPGSSSSAQKSPSGSSSAPTAPTAPKAPAAPSAGGDFASQIRSRAEQLRKGGQQ
jgi:hypothetical protein